MARPQPTATAHQPALGVAFAQLFARGSLSCRTVVDDEYLALAVESWSWSCVAWLLSAALGGASAGAVAAGREADVAALVAELLSAVQAWLAHKGPCLGLWAGCMRLGAELQPDAVTESLQSYSRAVAGVRPLKAMALAEWWRRKSFVLACGGAQPLAAGLGRAGLQKPAAGTGR